MRITDLLKLGRIIFFSYLIIHYNFFNFISTTSWTFAGVTVHDYLIVIFTGITIIFYNRIRLRKRFHSATFKSFKIISLIYIIYFLTMEFREGSMFASFLIFRKFFIPFILFYFIYLDTILNNNFSFYLKVFSLFSVLFSISFIIKFFTESIGLNFIIGQDGFVFISLTIIYNFILYVKGCSKLNYYNFILILGLVLQLYSSYLLSTIAIIIVIFLIQSKRLIINNIIRYFFILGLSFFVFIFFSNNIFQEQSVVNQINSSVEALQSNSGNYGIRIERDKIYRLPMFYKSPYYGYGFISEKSDYAKELGINRNDDSRAFHIIHIDSGFLTYLLVFGIIGCALIVLAYFRIIIDAFINIIKNKDTKGYSLLFLIAILQAFLVSPVLASLLFDFSMIPIAIIAALMSSDLYITRFNVKKTAIQHYRKEKVVLFNLEYKNINN